VLWTLQDTAKKDGVATTKKMAQELKKRYKNIWFKRQSIYKLLDSDQVVIFNLSIISCVNTTLTKGMDVGSRVEKISRVDLQK
jgi:hypothetical protein